jgi:hypothetical protein
MSVSQTNYFPNILPKPLVKEVSDFYIEPKAIAKTMLILERVRPWVHSEN